MRIGGRGKAVACAAGARAMLHRFSNFSHLGQVLLARRVSTHGTRNFVGLEALAAAASGFALLLALLDRGLHVMSAALQLTQDAFRSHLALEVLDRTLDAFVADLNLERPALNRFAGISQGMADMTDRARLGKPRSG